MPHFLFIGSDSSLGDQLRLALSDSPDFILDVACSHGEAEQILSAGEHSLVFLEEGLTTPEFVEALRQSESAVFVIALISSEDSTLGERMLDVGAVDFLSREQLDTGHVGRAVHCALAQRQLWLSLRVAEDRHWLLLQNSSQGIWRFEFTPPIALDASPEEQVRLIIERGCLVECNDAKAQMYGFERASQIQGMWLRDMVAGNEPAVHEFLQQFVRSQFLLRGTEIMEFDRYGEPKHFRQNVTGIIEGGHLMGMWGAQSDITATKQSDTMQTRLKSIIESSHEAIFTVSLEGVIMSWNQGAQEILGFSAAEAVGQTLHLVVPPHLVPDARSILEKVRRGERIPNYETQRLHKNGTLREVSLSVSPLVDAQGTVVGMWALGRDMTERKWAEEEVRRSEKLYHTLASNFPNGSVYLLDLQEHFLLAEGEGLSSVGLNREEIVGKTISDVFGATPISSYLLDAYAQALNGTNTVDEVEFNGHHRLVQIIPVHDEHDFVTHVLAMTQDITEQRQARLALERSEKLYSTLINNFPNGSVVLFDRDHRCLVAGGRGLAQIGIEAKQLVGKTIREVFGDAFDPEQAESLFHNTLHGREFDGEISLGGRYRRLHGVPVHENGQVTHVMMMTQDITEQKISRLALERSEKLYSALASHFPNGAVYLLDLNARFLLAEGQSINSGRKKREEIIGKTISEVFPVMPVGGRLLDAYTKALSGNTTAEEIEFGGRHRYVQIIPVRDEQGDVIHVLMMSQDITEQKRSRLALERSEKLYSTLASNFPNGSVLLLDRDLRLVLAEGRGLVQLGIDKQQIVGRKLRDVFATLSGAEKLEAFYRQALEGQEVSFETALGDFYRWVHVVPVRENEQITGVLGISQDITERKRMEVALRESEELNRAVLDSMLANIVVLDSTGVITAVNEPWREFARENGLGGESLHAYGVGTNYLQACAQSMSSSPSESASAALGIRAVLEGRESSFTLEYPCHCEDQQRWFQMTVTPLATAKGGVVVSHIPVTERRMAEQALRASEERLRAFLDNTPASVFIKDEEGHYLYLNKACEVSMQKPVQELLGRTAFSHMPTEFAQEVHEKSLEVLCTGQAVESEEITPGDATTPRHQIVVRFPLIEPSGQRLVAGVAIDITERKRIEEELWHSQEQLTLAQSIAHLGHIQHEGMTDRGFWSDEIYRIFGLEPQSVGGSYQRFLALIHPDDRHTMPPSIDAFSASFGDDERNFRIIRPNGEVRWVRGKALLTYDEDGHLLSLVTTILDITDLKKAEDERDRFFELSPDMMVISDTKGYFKRINPAWNEVLGYGHDEMLASPFIDFVHPDDREATLQEASQIYAGRRALRFENRYRCRDGSYKLLQWNTILDPTTEMVYSVATDITQRRQDEVELLEGRNRLASVINSALDAIITVDEQNCITEFNPAAENIFGHSRAQVLGRNLAKTIIPPAFRDAHSAGVARFLSTGEARVLDRRLELSALRASGEEFPVELSATAISVDGQFTFTAFMRDITQRKQAEAELRESEARFRSMADTAPVLIWMSDAARVCIYLNATWQEFTGRNIEDELGDGWTLGVHPDDLSHCLDIYTCSFEARQPFEMEYRLMRRDGVYRWLLDRGVPRFSPDGVFLGYIGTCVDIDDAKRAHVELAQSQQRLSAIVNSAMDAIITTNDDMRIVLFNPAAEQMFGCSASDVVGESLERFIPHRYRVAHAGHMTHFAKTGTTGRRMGTLGALSGLRCDGEEFPIEASISQIQLDEQQLFTVILRDITGREKAERELRSSQERLEVAVQGGQIGLWEWSVGSDNIHISGHYKKQLGYGADEFDNSVAAHLDSIHPEDKESFLAGFDEFLSGDSPYYQGEFRVRHKDGTYRWILSQGTGIHDSNGRVERILGSHIDITTLKESEEELVRSREALQLAHDDLERRVEERTRELGQTNEALRVESIERKGALLALQEAVAQLEKARDAAERANTELRANEARLLHGNRVFTELTKLRVAVQSELEDALRAITQAGCEVLDLERCSIWLYNEDKTGIRCLDLYERTSEHHSQGLELCVSDYPNYFRALQSRESIVADDAHTHPATSDFSSTYLTPLGISSMLDVPIVISGQMMGVLCCEQVGDARQWKVEDRTSASSLAGICSLTLESLERARAETDLRQAKNEAEIAREEAENANQAKSEFLSRMSHELRTPMNSILGFAQILQMHLTDEKHLQRVGLILKAGRHLLQLINEVLDVARVESGHISLSPEPVPVEGVVNMTVDLVRPLYQQLHLNLEFDLESCRVFFVWADQQRLSQVLLNLLSNAGKYNRDGGTVTVHCEPRGRMLRLSVADTGLGIAPDLLQKVFLPFERLGREVSSIEGTGLGLTLSKRLIEIMGGRMGVESEVEVGSTFWIELPLSESPLQKIAETPQVEFSHFTPSQKHTILYIEDNSANLQVLEHLLEDDASIGLISAMQGQRGLELARQYLPSLILLDLHLPDILGDEVLERILADPNLKDIPVIMLSADATPSQITRLLAAGAAEYLTKPLDMHLLRSVIYKFIGERPN